MATELGRESPGLTLRACALGCRATLSREARACVQGFSLHSVCEGLHLSVPESHLQTDRPTQERPDQTRPGGRVIGAPSRRGTNVLFLPDFHSPSPVPHCHRIQNTRALPCPSKVACAACTAGQPSSSCGPLHPGLRCNAIYLRAVRLVTL